MPFADHPQQQFGTLYTDHRGWLFGWLRKKLSCAAQAEDITHDTFLLLMSRPRQIDPAQNPRAYMSTIAHGLVVDHWRRREIERAWLATLAAQPEATMPSAEYAALVIETLAEIDRLLAALPDKPRQAFLMAQLHGMAYAEIAEHLGVSERMIKKYMAQVMMHCLLTTTAFHAAAA